MLQIPLILLKSSNFNTQEVINKILHEEQKPIPKIYSQFIQDLVQKLLQKDQYKRPSIDKILNSPEILKYVIF